MLSAIFTPREESAITLSLLMPSSRQMHFLHARPLLDSGSSGIDYGISLAEGSL